MLESWIFWALLAALMQSVRTAGQKYLTDHISALGATLVRYLFGLPFAVAYLLLLVHRSDGSLPDLNDTFILSVLLAGILQIIATILLIRLFTFRNFAVGSTYVRSEIMLTAIIGAVFFAEAVSLLGWLAIAVIFAGLIVISSGRVSSGRVSSGRVSSGRVSPGRTSLGGKGKLEGLWNRSAAYGLGAGAMFALTSLLIRQASLSLGIQDAMLSAAITLAFMISMQTVITFFWVLKQNAAEIVTIMHQWRPSLFVGITSVVGSAGWFTAFTLERAAYVKTLGQVEFLITLTIAVLYFKEIPSKPELTGMLLIVVGVIVLLLSV